MKLLTLLTFLFGAMTGAFAEYDGSEYLEKGKLIEGRVCYDQCKPKKKLLGITGDVQDGPERKSCITCLTKYPQIYTVKKDKIPDVQSVTCTEFNNLTMIETDLCFKECKPKKQILGLVGKVKDSCTGNTCTSCLVKYPEIYSIDQAYIDEKTQKSFLSPEANGAHIAEGEACYQECRPKKQFLGLVGKTKSNAERKDCLPCLKKNSHIYKLTNPVDPDAANCTISSDRIYAHCNGDVYRLDTSVSNIERVQLKEGSLHIPMEHEKRPAPSSEAGNQ